MIFKRSSTAGHRTITLRRMIRKYVASPLRSLRAPRVPTAMITGSNGKTTTSRMLAHILACSGRTVGLACTDGVYIAGQKVRDGDWSGYIGAKRVFAHNTIDAAVLETARGGLISSGLYTRRCHVAALLNVQDDQIGIDGINSLDAMAAHKRQVTDAATDRVVLGLDDSRCRRMAAQYTPSKVTLFSIDPRQGEIEERMSSGCRVCTLDEAEEWIMLLSPDQPPLKVARVNDIPATMQGVVRHNLLNAMAAAALADGLQVEPQAIARGLTTFGNSPDMNPGRFNTFHDYPFTVVLDRARSAPSLAGSVACFMQLPCAGRRVCMISCAGNRTDSTYDEMATAIAGHFGHYICFEKDDLRRGRQPGEIAQRLAHGLAAQGVDDKHITCTLTPADAFMQLKSLVTSSDLVYANTLSPVELNEAAQASFGGR